MSAPKDENRYPPCGGESCPRGQGEDSPMWPRGEMDWSIQNGSGENPSSILASGMVRRLSARHAVLNAEVWRPGARLEPGTIVETDCAILLACEPEHGGTHCLGAWRGHLERCDGKPNANAGISDAVVRRAVEVAAVATQCWRHVTRSA